MTLILQTHDSVSNHRRHSEQSVCSTDRTNCKKMISINHSSRSVKNLFNTSYYHHLHRCHHHHHLLHSDELNKVFHDILSLKVQSCSFIVRQEMNDNSIIKVTTEPPSSSSIVTLAGTLAAHSYRFLLKWSYLRHLSPGVSFACPQP